MALPDISTNLGIRDKAILEFAYATGVRATELVKMLLSNVWLDEGFIKCFGKGNKERLVPLGSVAVYYLKKYLTESRPELCKKQRHNYLFVNRHGKPMTRAGYWYILKKYAKKTLL